MSEELYMEDGGKTFGPMTIEEGAELVSIANRVIVFNFRKPPLPRRTRPVPVDGAEVQKRHVEVDR